MRLRSTLNLRSRLATAFGIAGSPTATALLIVQAGIGEQFSTHIRSGHRRRSHAAGPMLDLDFDFTWAYLLLWTAGLYHEDSIRFGDAVRPEQCKRAGEFVALTGAL